MTARLKTTGSRADAQDGEPGGGADIDSTQCEDTNVRAAHLEAVYEHSFDGILITSPDGRILDANPAACSLLGYTVAELRRLGRAGVADPEDPRWYAAVTERERYGRTRARLAFRHADGSSVETELSATVFEVDGELRSAIIVRDIRDQVRLEQQLRDAAAEQTRLALTDELTGLSNRRSFFVRAGQLLAGAQHDRRIVHLLVSDVDDLKTVNDEHGHAAGDTLLREVARTLQLHFPEAPLVARLSGDEFAVVLVGRASAEVDRLVGTLPDALARRAAAEGLPFTPRISVGVAPCAPGRATDLDSLLARADSSMYREKGRVSGPGPGPGD